MMKRCRILQYFLAVLVLVFLTTMLFNDYLGAQKTTTLRTLQQQIIDQIHQHNITAQQHKQTQTATRRTYAFLKVHKAASTTTQAIFLRYGWTRNMTFILPPEYNKFGYPNIISTNESLTIYNTLPPPGNKTYDILCHHVVYEQAAWDKFFPHKPYTAGTVREPWSLFKSSINYFNPITLRIINAKDKLEEFLKNPEKYNKGVVRSSYINNRLAFEYGVDPDIIRTRNIEAFTMYLHNVLDKVFDVVIVNEMYDESLVLMRRLFKWSLNDIIYAKKNVRSVSKPDRYETKAGFEEMYRKYAIFDYMLYEFFLKRLRRQILEQGAYFHLELQHFRETREYIEKFCHFVPTSIKSVVISKSDWNDQFEITRTDCDVLHKGEIEFTQEIRRKHYGTATWIWH